MRAAFLRVLLALVLLLGAQGALVHPLVHLDEAGAPVHRAAGHDAHEGHEEGEVALCEAIDAIGTSAHAVPRLLAPASRVGSSRVGAARSERACAPALAYRSQAPPSALL